MSETAENTPDVTGPPEGDHQALADALASQRNTDHDPDAGESSNHEAAKWRTKLRDTEAQNAALTTRLEAMQRHAIETRVAALGIKPRAVWAAGAQLADLLDDDGVPDAAKVEAAVQNAKDALGIPTPPKPALSSLKSLKLLVLSVVDFRKCCRATGTCLVRQ